ncbi:MAG: hypothetical protein KGZ69_13595 [Methylomonas sp.]|nr:hypothetical protein [Methylomonas sp.]
MAKSKNGIPAALLKKPHKQKYTLNMALRAAGISSEEEKYLTEPRIALAMAKAAHREIRKAKDEADKLLKDRKSAILAEVLKKTK